MRSSSQQPIVRSWTPTSSATCRRELPAAALLQETLDEEGAADHKLTELAETIINVEAEAADDEEEEAMPAAANGKAKAAVKK